MNLQNNYLVLGGIGSLLIALLHIALAIKPSIYRCFGAAELSKLQEQGSPFTAIVTIGLVILFASWGLYALSGAGVIKPLPLLRGVLLTIGIIYILRSLMMPSELLKVIRSGYPFRSILLSTGSLAIGLLYLYGTQARQPGKRSAARHRFQALF